MEKLATKVSEAANVFDEIETAEMLEYFDSFDWHTWCKSQVCRLSSAKEELKNISDSKKNPFTVAVIGGFSSGKSKFINSILGKKIAPEAIIKTTHNITYFTYGEKCTIKEKSSNKNYTLADYQRIVKLEGQKKEFYITYPCEFLKNKIIVDTIGVDEDHNNDMPQEDKDVAQKANVILFVISVANGTIHDSEIKLLQKIFNDTNENKPELYIILNQIDKKTQSVCKNVKDEILHVCKKNNIPAGNILFYCSHMPENYASEVCDDTEMIQFLKDSREKMLSALNDMQKRQEDLLKCYITKKQNKSVYNLSESVSGILKELDKIKIRSHYEGKSEYMMETEIKCAVRNACKEYLKYIDIFIVKEGWVSDDITGFKYMDDANNWVETPDFIEEEGGSFQERFDDLCENIFYDLSDELYRYVKDEEKIKLDCLLSSKKLKNTKALIKDKIPSLVVKISEDEIEECAKYLYNMAQRKEKKLYEKYKFVFNKLKNLLKEILSICKKKEA